MYRGPTPRRTVHALGVKYLMYLDDRVLLEARVTFLSTSPNLTHGDLISNYYHPEYDLSVVTAVLGLKCKDNFLARYDRPNDQSYASFIPKGRPYQGRIQDLKRRGRSGACPQHFFCQFRGLLKNLAQEGVGVRPCPPPLLDPRLPTHCSQHHHNSSPGQ